MGLQNCLQDSYRNVPVLTGIRESMSFTELEHRAYWAIKLLDYELTQAHVKRCLDLNEIMEIHFDPYESAKLYKERTKRLQDLQIRHEDFAVDNSVLFNSRLKLFPGKLKSRWHGPFAVKKIHESEAITNGSVGEE